MPFDTPVPDAASTRPLTRRELRAMAEAAAAAAEPVVPVVESTVGSAAPAGEDAAAAADSFEAAARLFSFTGETPTQGVAEALQPSEDEVEQDAAASDVEDVDAAEPASAGRKAGAARSGSARSARPGRRGRGFTVRRVAATSASVASMAVVGLLAIGMTTPSGAVAAADFGVTNAAAPGTDVTAPTDAEADEIQVYVAPAEVENVEVDRGEASYETASMRDIAAAEGVTTFSSLFTNDPTAAIQWPFMVGVPMSYGYGPRWGAMHTGIDLTPGNGAEIHAIADGVVRSASPSTGGYGVNIYIDHVIDGKVVTSHYAHMQHGSMRVKTGDRVKVGQVIGLVGNTGRSFGAHLHFEILLGGTQFIDPLPWMRENAGRHDLGN